MAPEQSRSDDNSTLRERSRAACDACRARKVKCQYNDGDVTCRACLDLNVDCTRERPRKRRGPPNSYLEQERQRKQQRQAPPQQAIVDDQSTYEQQAHALDPRNLASLAPAFLIQEVLDDWFNLVHPVAPILYRETFLQQLHDASRHNDSFVCLVVSICAATVTTLRRKTLEYASIITVEKCHETIRQIDQSPADQPINLIRCQIKYNMAVALGSENGMDYPLSQIMLAEATAMVGRIIHYDMQSLSLCDRELTKRLYWLCFAAQCTLGLHGRPYLMPISAFANIDPLLPRDLADKELHEGLHVDESWNDTNSYIPGLNALSNLFILWYKSQQADTSDLTHLRHYLGLVMSSLDHIPPELRWRGGLSRPPKSDFGTDVQMVNLYITQIHIRSFLLEQMTSVAQSSHNTAVLDEISTSRQNLVNDMLAIVYQMPEDTLEANGHSLISKLRDIGLSLLNESGSAMSFVNLDRLLAKLDRLDVRAGNSHADQAHSVAASSSPGYTLSF